jgi:hypothetical protein
VPGPPTIGTRPPWLRDPAHGWRAGTLDRTLFAATADELARSEGFDIVARRFAEAWLQTQADHPELRAVFRNTPRYLLLVAAMVLHHRRDARDPASGITAGRLLEFFRHTARPAVSVSPGQVKAMLAHARLHGLLQPVAAHATLRADSRVRPLQPTPVLERTMQAWVAGFLRAIEPVPTLPLPLPAPAPTMLRTPGVVAEMFSYRLAAMREDGFVLFEGQPGLRWVLAHDQGYRVFLHLVRTTRPRPGGGAQSETSLAELARLSGASRGTVRNLLADARALGWFDDDPAGALKLNAAAWHTALHWVARELIWMHGLLGEAYANRYRLAARAG